MFAVMHAKAGPGFRERIEANPDNWQTPERRLVFSIPWEESVFVPANMGIVCLRGPMVNPIRLPGQELQPSGDQLFIFDARTPEEKDEITVRLRTEPGEGEMSVTFSGLQRAENLFTDLAAKCQAIADGLKPRVHPED